MEPVVLIPGTLCDEWVWKHQKEHLSTYTEVYVADITKDSSIEHMASTVLQTAPDTFALAGISQGAITAMEIMRRAPHRVTKAALLDTSAGEASPQQISTWQEQLRLVEEGRFHDVVEEQFIPALLHHHKYAADVVDNLRKMTERVGAEGFMYQVHANMTRPNAKKMLPYAECPVLILAGREDALSSMESHREMADLIPDSKLIYIDNCGHLSTVDQPEAVTAVLMYWLQEEGRHAGQ
ncbi:alpha/beta fold hydrolase [Salibacterium sp. K-3]